MPPRSDDRKPKDRPSAAGANSLYDSLIEVQQWNPLKTAERKYGGETAAHYGIDE